MAKTLGSGAQIALSVPGGGFGVTYLTVGKVKSISPSPSYTMVDATDNDSNGNKEKLPGDADMKFGVTCNFDSSDAAQMAIINAGGTKDLCYWRYRPKGQATGEYQWIGLGYATNPRVDAKHEAVMELNFDVEISGAWTRSVQ